VVYFIEPEGYIVTRFINGKRLPPDEIVKPDNIVRVVRKVRLFHRRGPELKGEFNVFHRVEMLTKISKSNNCKFPFDWGWIMQKKAEVEKALSKDPYIPTPCHDDLLNLNWLEEDVPEKSAKFACWIGNTRVWVIFFMTWQTSASIIA